MCVCLWVNLFDVISLGVKVYQSLPFRTPLHPQVERQATLRTVDGSQTFMVMKARYSQSQWRRSCSSRWKFRQIWSCEGSSRLRYCLSKGWWPDRRQARRASSFLLFICFASRETLRCWYTEATHSCVAGASRIVSLITSMELDREIGRIVSVALLVAPLVSLSARSLPGMTEWPGIHWMKMEDDMDLMELWIENVRGWNEMSASRKDLLSVQKSIEIERWLVLVDVQDSADSMAADSSSQELVNVLPFVLMVVTTKGWSGDLLVTTVAAPPFLIPVLADPLV